MENPLSGVMEWYQGLPQAAQIGIPVVGVGAVYLIAKGKGSGGTGGSVVAGPFGSSTGGGQAVSGAGNAGGSNGAGSSPSGTTSPNPKPSPWPGSHLGLHDKPKPTSIGSNKPKPAGTHAPALHPHPIVSPKPEPVQAKAPTIQPGHPVLPSSHISSVPVITQASSLAYQRGLHQSGGAAALTSTKTTAAPSVANTKAAAVGPSSLTYQRGLHQSGTTVAPKTIAKPKVTATQVRTTAAKHPVKNTGLHNTVPTTKAHQVVNDKNKFAVNKLTQQRGIHQAGRAL